MIFFVKNQCSEENSISSKLVDTLSYALACDHMHYRGNKRCVDELVLKIHQHDSSKILIVEGKDFSLFPDNDNEICLIDSKKIDTHSISKSSTFSKNKFADTKHSVNVNGKSFLEIVKEVVSIILFSGLSGLQLEAAKPKIDEVMFKLDLNNYVKKDSRYLSVNGNIITTETPIALIDIIAKYDCVSANSIELHESSGKLIAQYAPYDSFIENQMCLHANVVNLLTRVK